MNKNPFLLGRTKYVKGNAAMPATGDSRTIILFVPTTGNFEEIKTNADIGKTYINAKNEYRLWWRSQTNFRPGLIHTKQASSTTELAYLLACIESDGEVGFSEEDLVQSIKNLAKHLAMTKNNIHVNKCGTPEEWEIIEKTLEDELASKGHNLYVYE